MCHVITWSGDVSHRSGKDMRKKDEEWPRTGTFCAAWGRISVMQWPIFTGHFEALRLLRFSVHLKIQSVMYVCVYVVTSIDFRSLALHVASPRRPGPKVQMDGWAWNKDLLEQY